MQYSFFGTSRGAIMKDKRPPELPGQLEFDFNENTKLKYLERYVQQNAGIRLVALETNMLNSSKLDWISDGKIVLGLGVKQSNK